MTEARGASPTPPCADDARLHGRKGDLHVEIKTRFKLEKGDIEEPAEGNKSNKSNDLQVLGTNAAPGAAQEALPGQQALLKRIHAIGSLCRLYPHIVIIPATLLALMIGLGCWGVSQGIQNTTSASRVTLTKDLAEAAIGIQGSLKTAVLPLGQIARLVQKEPNYDKALQLWDELVPLLYLAVPGALSSLLLIYAGVIVRVWPANNNNPSGSMVAGNATYIGRNFLALNDALRPMVLAAIPKTEASLASVVSVAGSDWAMFSESVFVSNVSVDEDFGGGRQPTACPMCYVEANHSKNWGLVATTINANQVLQHDPALRNIRDNGWHFCLWRPGDTQLGEPALLAIAPLDGDPAVQPADASCVDVAVVDRSWQLCSWMEDWRPAWMPVLYAVVALGSVIICSLLFMVLLTRVEKLVLLDSLVPGPIIDRLQAGDWEEDLQDAATKTPAELMIKIIHECLHDMMPSTPLLLAVRSALQRSQDVYRPTIQGLAERIQNAEYLDAEMRNFLVKDYLDSNRVPWDAVELSGPTFNHQSSRTGRGAGRRASLMFNMDGSDPGVEDVPYELEGLLPEQATLVHIMTHIGGFAATSRASSFKRSASRRNSSLLEVLGGYADQLFRTVSAAQIDSPSTVTPVVPVVPVVPMPRAPPLPEVEQVLATANAWDFDSLLLERITQGHALSTLGFWLLHSTGLIAWGKLSTRKLVRFLLKVEAGYKSKKNPYHNSAHAADVLQGMHMVITRGGFMPGYVDQAAQLTCYLAAIIHDYEHMGRTNDFLVNSEDSLALDYNDKSVLENHHLAAAFRLMQQPEMAFLDVLGSRMKAKIRKLTIELVLATDMKQHFAILGQFDVLHGASLEPKDLSRRGSASLSRKGSANMRSSASSVDPSIQAGAQPSLLPDGATRSEPVLFPVSENDRVLSLQMALKVADLINLSKPMHVHYQWVLALEQELFLQGDAEREAGLPLSPLCDRNSEGVTTSQVGFYDIVAAPFFTSFVGRFHRCKPVLAGVMANRQHYFQQALAKKTAEIESQQ